MSGLIDVILQRISDNNRPTGSKFNEAILSGRREAYEDVLHLLGFYDDELEPKYKRRAS